MRIRYQGPHRFRLYDDQGRDFTHALPLSAVHIELGHDRATVQMVAAEGMPFDVRVAREHATLVVQLPRPSDWPAFANIEADQARLKDFARALLVQLSGPNVVVDEQAIADIVREWVSQHPLALEHYCHDHELPAGPDGRCVACPVPA